MNVLGLLTLRGLNHLPSLIVPLLFAGLLTGCSTRPMAATPSEIKKDEQVVFFPTAACLSDDGSSWIVPVHGWIFEPEQNDFLRKTALKQLFNALELDERQASGKVFEERARQFLVDNERGKRIAIRLGAKHYTFGPSDPDGHFMGTITVSKDEAQQSATGHLLTFKAVTRSNDHREFRGVAHLIEGSGVSVISDIDDTVKVTEVRDKKKLIENTFFQPFRDVEGMAETYRRWADAGAQFHFVSSSPWQLYEPLSQFLSDAGFPDATFHLKRLRIKDRSFLNLFADPLESKQQVIVPLLAAYPQRQFVLVGDSGEKDPEVYGLIARRFPNQIAKIYIRNVTDEPADSARYQQAFTGLSPEQWTIVDDPQTLKLSEK
jgi:phosphatidate phosphatase APP1